MSKYVFDRTKEDIEVHIENLQKLIDTTQNIKLDIPEGGLDSIGLAIKDVANSSNNLIRDIGKLMDEINGK